MTALRLKENVVALLPPEVRDRIAGMSATRQHLEHTVAVAIRTRLALLLLARLVADGRSDVHLVARFKHTTFRADQNTETALLENLHIVVVRVAHRPAGVVFLGELVIRAVDQALVAVHPFLETVHGVRELGQIAVVDVPVERAPLQTTHFVSHLRRLTNHRRKELSTSTQSSLESPRIGR